MYCRIPDYFRPDKVLQKISEVTCGHGGVLFGGSTELGDDVVHVDYEVPKDVIG